jgi:hypothetical protein
MGKKESDICNDEYDYIIIALKDFINVLKYNSKKIDIIAFARTLRILADQIDENHN